MPPFNDCLTLAFAGAFLTRCAYDCTCHKACTLAGVICDMTLLFVVLEGRTVHLALGGPQQFAGPCTQLHPAGMQFRARQAAAAAQHSVLLMGNIEQSRKLSY